MKSKITWILTLCLAFFIQFSFAQEKMISGTVVSKTDKMTMPGVSIKVQGTTRGVQTDFDGKYSIKAAVGQKLEFSFLGSKTQVVPVGASNTVNVSLEDEAAQLQDVVVEGYNITKTRAKSNVASVTVDSKVLDGRPNANFIQSMQGQVAGLSVNTSSGQPGANSTVIIRGVGSINGKVEPLYVIDNVPMNSDNFRSLNPNEIESISVLKDGGATAIYGSRAANGVIVVKTKRGSFDSSLKVNYSAQTGFSTFIGNKYNMMNGQQLLALEAAKGVGVGAGLDLNNGTYTLTPAQIQDRYGNVNTDWRKVFFRTGVTQNHVMNLMSGSKTVNSFTSLGYFAQQGTLQATDIQRFSLRSNVDGRSTNDRFNYSTSISLNFSRNHSASSIGSGSVNHNLALGAYKAVPYLSPSDYHGGQDLVDKYNAYPTLLYTPLFLLDKLKTYQTTSDELKGIAALQASYKIAKDWTLGTNLGLDYTQGDAFGYTDPSAFNSIYFYSQTKYLGSEGHSYSRDLALNWNNRLNYNKTFKEKHSVDLTLFSEYFKANMNGFSMNQNGLDPKTASPGAGTGYLSSVPQNGQDLFVPTVGASKASTGLFSYFLVGDYDYASRFGFGASIRRDASSRFADSNKWGTFFSVTGRWNIDREKFMDGSVFSMLKLRASYGSNGNQDILNGTYSGLNLTRELYGSGSGYQGLQSYQVSQLANPNLKWETTYQGNIGVDFEMLKKRFRGNLDGYNKKTTDLYQPVLISAVNGTTSIYANYGDMYNRGFEYNFAYDLIKNPAGFNFTLKANGSYNKNRITSIPSSTGLVDNGTTVNAVGHRLGEYYLVRYAGVNPADGNLLFYTKDGQLTENPDQDKDRVFTGKSVLPVWQGGFGFDADYKGFFFTTQFSWVTGVYRFDGDLASDQAVTDIGQFNKSNDLQRAWTPTNTHTDIPSLFFTNTAADNQSNRYLVDASYLRLKFMSFGYSFNKKMLNKTPFTSLKTYVNAENMLTWSKWRGSDPQSGVQNGYPSPRIVSLGLQLEL